jgi:hypothetical protein
VQVPSEDVTTVRPSELEVDMLVEPVPGPACVDTVGPAPVVDPDTLPLPALTELVMPPAEDVDVFGGFSPGFRWTVLQLPLGPDDEDVLPSEDAALDELVLSACAQTTVAANATAAAQYVACFIWVFLV